MTVAVKKDTRAGLLKAIFAKAKRAGIDEELLRERIAPEVIGMRLSAATTQELHKVVVHLASLEGESKPKGRYASSKAGLVAELEDVARARWGDGFEAPLNTFINHNRKAKTHLRFLDVAALKGIKERIKELNRKDGIDNGDASCQ